MAVTTEKCGGKTWYEGPIHDYRIDYCPMHKAAPQMLAALEAFTEGFGPVTHPPLPGFPGETYISPAANSIRAEIAEQASEALAAARGQEAT